MNIAGKIAVEAKYRPAQFNGRTGAVVRNSTLTRLGGVPTRDISLVFTSPPCGVNGGFSNLVRT